MTIAADRTWYDTLVDDSGANKDGTIIEKADIDALLDAVDTALATISTTLDDNGAVSFAAPSELTIASGAVTVTAGNNVFSVDTEGDASADDLDTITLDAGGRECRLLILKPENVARVVTVKDGTGNLSLKGGDFAMSDAKDRLVLYRDGTTWYELARTGGGSAVGGSDTQVQFNDGGAFGGDSGFTFNKTSKAVTVAGDLVLSANTLLRRSTSDGSDNGSVELNGGGGSGSSRGGGITVYGNEAASPGTVVTQIGNVTGAKSQVKRSDGTTALEVDGATGDVYTTSWTDYTATSTITGWSSFVSQRKFIKYKKIGKTVFVAFHLEGTSNATVANFTLPFTAATVGTVFDFSAGLGQAYDNGAAITTPGRLRMANASAQVDCWKTYDNGGWTSSGTKIVQGQFWYEAAA